MRIPAPTFLARVYKEVLHDYTLDGCYMSPKKIGTFRNAVRSYQRLLQDLLMRRTTRSIKALVAHPTAVFLLKSVMDNCRLL